MEDENRVKRIFEEFNSSHPDMFYESVYNYDEDNRRKAMIDYSKHLIGYVLTKNAQ